MYQEIAMDIFDFNIHLTQLDSFANPHLQSDETTMSVEELEENLESHLASIHKGVSAANFMLFNPVLFFKEDLTGFIDRCIKYMPNSIVSTVIDFRNSAAVEAVDNAARQGVKAIKFHSYFQKITKDDFANVLSVAKRAEKRGMFICIDTSYGTSGMYKYDNMLLACMLSDELNCPIVLMHSGGLRVFEAMLLAEEKSNVYLETSFTLNYYENSSVEDNIYFAYQKIGSKKILYGSDYPYVEIDSALKMLSKISLNCGFNDMEIEMVSHGNALRLSQNL